MAGVKRTILTQIGDPESDGGAISEALALGLLALPTGEAPSAGMVLKLLDGKVGWFPARLQVPPLPYQAPIVTTSSPVGTGVLASLANAITTINLLVTEQQRLVASHNTLLEHMANNGYMLPKPAA